MRYLLDTAVFLFVLMDERQRVSPRAKRILKDGGNSFCLSVASVWEIAIKHSLQKITFKGSLPDVLTDAIGKMQLEILPITMEPALRATDLPFYHPDPFDRLLISQSQMESIPIITPDRNFKKYRVKVIW